jgi:hypothetical protein
MGLDALVRLAEQWTNNLAEAGKTDRQVARLKALTTYCHAIMNSASFLYVD